MALTELVERHEQKDLYDLFESDEQLIAEDYDYKAMRGGSLIDLTRFMKFYRARKPKSSFFKLKSYLSTQKIFYLPNSGHTYCVHSYC